MLDQLSIENYGFGCKMRVTTAVSLLGLVGIIISSQVLRAGFVLLSVSSHIFGHNYPIIIFAVVTILISLVLLILNIFLIKRNSAGSFIGVMSNLRFLCSFCLFLQLIASLIINILYYNHLHWPMEIMVVGTCTGFYNFGLFVVLYNMMEVSED